MTIINYSLLSLLIICCSATVINALTVVTDDSKARCHRSNPPASSPQQQQPHPLINTIATSCCPSSRRDVLGGWAKAAGAATVVAFFPPMTKDAAVAAGPDDIPAKFNADNYLRTGSVANPMGVSGQAGKSRPRTGVLLLDGSEPSRNPKTGDVLAEILVSSGGSGKVPILASYSSPWPLQTGEVYDVECRDAATGDDTFLAVTPGVGGKSVTDLPDSFFVKFLMSPTGRFSSYGQPTDVKVVKGKSAAAASSSLDSNQYRVFDMTFSTLSQSTASEIPRHARVVATIPEGTTQAVMLVTSANALRWKKGAISDQTIKSVTESFRAVPAPTTSLKVRAKQRRN